MGNTNVNLREEIRQNHRLINRSIRHTQCEIVKMEMKQQRLANAIQASTSDPNRLRHLAQRYGVSKYSIRQMEGLILRLDKVESKIQMMQSTSEVHATMQQLAQVMRVMNRSLQLDSIQTMIRHFEQDSAKNNVVMDTMMEACDDCLDNQDVDEEYDISEILKEVGVQDTPLIHRSEQKIAQMI